MKSIFILSLLLCISQSVWATQARVSTLGGETAMLPDDDTNIDLFPQHINNWEFLRVANINQTSGPNTGEYAMIIGDEGDKWGIYGGQTEVNDFVNVYRSFGKDLAAKIGITLSTRDTEIGSTAPGTDTIKTEYTEFGVNATIGASDGQTDYAFTIEHATDPAANFGCFGSPNIGGACGKSNTTNNGVETESATKSYKRYLIGGAVRTPKKIAMFSSMYVDGFLSNVSEDNEAINGTPTLSTSIKTTSIGINVLMFGNKTIAKNDLLVFGLGFGLIQAKRTSIDNIANSNVIDETVTLGGPRIRLGLEKGIKYGVLRFGVQRNINFYNSRKLGTSSTTTSTTDDFSGIGRNGSYQISTGWGLTYNNLQIDIVLNSIFWKSGPQLIFDSSQGFIGTRADIVYAF